MSIVIRLSGFFFLLLLGHSVFAQVHSFGTKVHFTQGRFKIDSNKYKYINSKVVTIFKGPKDQSFEIEAIKSKELTFYTLTIKRGESIAMIINDFAVMSKTAKVRILKEGWIEDVDGDGFLDIVQREKTFILGTRRKPSAQYSNDKLRVRTWSVNSSAYIEKDKTDPIFLKALKKFNFKLYTLHKDKII